MSFKNNVSFVWIFKILNMYKYFSCIFYTNLRKLGFTHNLYEPMKPDKFVMRSWLLCFKIVLLCLCPFIYNPFFCLHFFHFYFDYYALSSLTFPPLSITFSFVSTSSISIFCLFNASFASSSPKPKVAPWFFRNVFIFPQACGFQSFSPCACDYFHCNIIVHGGGWSLTWFAKICQDHFFEV